MMYRRMTNANGAVHGLQRAIYTMLAFLFRPRAIPIQYGCAAIVAHGQQANPREETTMKRRYENGTWHDVDAWQRDGCASLIAAIVAATIIALTFLAANHSLARAIDRIVAAIM